MLLLAIQILLVAWLPGALLLRLPGRSRAYRASLPFDERLFWSVLLSLVWSTSLVLLLASFDRYSFDRLLTINALLGIIAVVAGRQRLRLPRPVRGPEWRAVVPAAIVALGVWLYFPPSEYIIGGKDPGAYINEGIQIAQRGQTVIRDPIVAEVPEAFRDLFMPDHGQDTYYSLRFMGFFVQDPDAGTVVGQFPHFYPASIAIGYGLNGLSGARQAIGVWAMLGVLAVFFAGARLFGVAAAAAAALLLAINVAFVWFARYPNSELPMQTLLFGALLAANRAREVRTSYFAVVAALLLGLSLFVRYETLIAIAAFIGAGVLAPVSGQRLGRAFGIVLAATAGLALAYLAGTMQAYTALPLGFIRNMGGWWLVGGLAVAAVLAHRLVRIEAMAGPVRRWLPIATAGSLALLAVYAYFFREVGGRTALGDAMAFRTFGWYVTPVGLLLATAGAVYFVWRDLWRDPTFYLTFPAFTTFFFYKTRIVPEHFWTARRFLGVALPAALLLMAGAVRTLLAPERLARLRGASWSNASSPVLQVASVVLMAAALAPVGYAYWQATAPVARHVEYAGVIPELERLAARIGDNDLLLVEGRNAGTDLHVFATPLAYIYARQLLVLESAAPDRQRFGAFVRWARERYDRVLFLGGGGTDLLTKTTRAVPLGGHRFQVPEYDSPLNAYPDGVHMKEFEFGLYALEAGIESRTGPFDLQIGGDADDLHVVRFHARETHADGTRYRWSTAQSFLVLPYVPDDARTLTIWMNRGGRPASAPPADVEVALDDHVLGTVRVDDATAPHELELPAALVESLADSGEPVRVRLRVSTWNPAEAFGAPDTRDLGVMVTRVTLQ